MAILPFLAFYGLGSLAIAATAFAPRMRLSDGDDNHGVRPLFHRAPVKQGSDPAFYTTAMPARIAARNVSMDTSPSFVSTCQNDQPLQASSPCATAPIRWME